MIHWDPPFEWETAINDLHCTVVIDGDLDLTEDGRNDAVNTIADHLVRNWTELPVGLEFGVWLRTPNGNAWAEGKKHRYGPNFVEEGPHPLPTP